MKMKKDEFIEKEFQNYFSGVNPPSGVTDDAKRLILERKSRRKLALRLSGFASVLACLVLIFSVTLYNKNANKITYYSTGDLKVETVSLSEVKDKTDEINLNSFEILEFASNANAEYYLYYDGSEIKFIEIKITCLNSYGREDVKIYIELTGKKNTCEDFKKYYGLENEEKYQGVSYEYANTNDNGEWVSKAFLQYNGYKYFLETQVSSVKVNGNYTLQKYLNLII